MTENSKQDEENTIDFDYILQYCNQRHHEIPYSFDKITWRVGGTYRIRIGNIYDPSKFWIVHYEKELNIFHKFINDFYGTRSEQYRMPQEYIKRKIYCTVYTDGAYYRGLIVDKPKINKLEPHVVVFLMDFGFTSVAPINNIFYMNEKMYNLPRFAIRACLSGIEPVEFGTWSNKAVEKFCEITRGKILLCILECRDTHQKIVHIKIGEMTALSQVQEISLVLVEEQLAKVMSGRRSRSIKTKGKLLSKVKYPFLFPSHQALESGLMPHLHSISEMLKQSFVPASILYRPYYYSKINTNSYL